MQKERFISMLLSRIYSLGLCCLFGLSLSLVSLAQNEIPSAPNGAAFQAQETKFLGFLKTHDPERLLKLQELKRYEPKLYTEVVANGISEMRYLDHLEQTHPELHQRRMREVAARVKLEGLVERYIRTNDSALKASLKSQLTTQLGVLFEIQTEDKATDVLIMEDELKTAKSVLAKRKKNKDLIVQKKLAEVLREDHLRW